LLSEQHTGPWRRKGYNQMPDTRPIEAHPERQTQFETVELKY